MKKIVFDLFLTLLFFSLLSMRPVSVSAQPGFLSQPVLQAVQEEIQRRQLTVEKTEKKSLPPKPSEDGRAGITAKDKVNKLK